MMVVGFTVFSNVLSRMLGARLTRLSAPFLLHSHLLPSQPRANLHMAHISALEHSVIDSYCLHIVITPGFLRQSRPVQRTIAPKGSADDHHPRSFGVHI